MFYFLYPQLFYQVPFSLAIVHISVKFAVCFGVGVSETCAFNNDSGFRSRARPPRSGSSIKRIKLCALPNDDDLKARSLLYASRLLESQLGRGERFGEAKRVYVIFFLDFVLFPQSAKVPRRYVFMEETEHDRLNELIEVIYYEMPKTADAVREYFEGKETLKTLPTEQKWCIYFKYRVEEGMEPLIDELRREEEGIMRADRALRKIERDREKRARAIFWDNQRLVYNSDMYAAKEKGLIEGRLEGSMAKQEEIARNALAEGASIGFVQKITGLDIDTIKSFDEP